MSESWRTLIIATLALVVLCLCWFTFLYKPRVSRLVELEQDTRELLVRVQSLRVNDRQIAALEMQVRLLREQIALLQKKIVAKDALPQVVGQLRRTGRRFGLKFDRIIPDFESLTRVEDADGASEVMKLTLHIKLQGNFRSFGRFIESLDKFPFLLSLGELSLNYNERIFPELEIMLDTVLYLRESEEAGSVKTASVL